MKYSAELERDMKAFYQGLRTKIAKMDKVGRHSLDRDPDEFSEKPGVF